MALRPLAVTSVLGVLASVLLAGPAQAAPPPTTSDFRGVNWADPRDNYAADAVVPSGLSATDDYATVYRVATRMVGDFRKNLGANTLRLPINPASVGTAWWRSYRAAIDAATAAGDKVILSYWEADTSKDGLIDDVAAWDAMWDTVVREYGRNPRVYLEPMNEPHGYPLDQWVSVAAGWIARHRSVARDHVVVSGTGYNDDVTGVGAAPELHGTLLSLHFYGFWASDTEKSAWLANLAARLGPYSNRTIIDEAGAPMTIGLNYGAHNGNTSTAYFAAVTETARAEHMGLVYWPGLRFGDSYSIESVGADGHLVNNSVSGVAQLRWGWGFGTTEPENDDPAAPPGEPLVNTASGRCLDVPGFSTTDGTQLDLWDCNGGGNQSFNWESNNEITVYGSTCLTAGLGDQVTIEACTGAADQQWTLTAEQTVTSVADPALCLDAPGGTNGAAVVVAACSGAASQSWSKG